MKLLKEAVNGQKSQEPEVIDLENPDSYLKSKFPGIEPTTKDFFLGKLYAYKLAAERKLQEEKELKVIERQRSITEMWSYTQMREKAVELGKVIGIAENFEFVLDKDNEGVFHLLCLYFTNNTEFEKHGIGDIKYSLNKGIWLQSSTRGSGKSVMLRCFYINKRCCFGYKHTRELATLFQKKGFEGVDIFIGTLPVSRTPLSFYQNEAGMMYDEMFTGEDKVMHMGSPLFMSEYIINSLYDFSTSKNKNQKWKFHCTSNASGEDIEKVSSINYRSRMADMFNLIKLDGPDRRRQ